MRVAIGVLAVVWLRSWRAWPNLRARRFWTLSSVWLAGLLFFSWFLNWHVNAADALLAVPPIVLLIFRNRRSANVDELDLMRL